MERAAGVTRLGILVLIAATLIPLPAFAGGLGGPGISFGWPRLPSWGELFGNQQCYWRADDAARELCDSIVELGNIPYTDETGAFDQDLVYMATPEYQTELAAEKKARILEQNDRTAYSVLPDMAYGSGFGGMLSFGWSFANQFWGFDKFFDEKTDVLPRRTQWFADDGRTFHRFGTLAGAELRPIPGQPYTGIFETGALATVRASIGAGDDNWISGLAVKALVDGQPSVNIVAIPHPDPQEGREFFKLQATTTIRDPEDIATNVGTVALSTVDDPSHRPLDTFAGITRSGDVVERPKMPYQLFFIVNNEEINIDPEADFRTEFSRIPVGEDGTVLATLYARHDKDDVRTIPVAEVVITEPFQASWFSDHIYNSQHRRRLIDSSSPVEYTGMTTRMSDIDPEAYTYGPPRQRFDSVALTYDADAGVTYADVAIPQHQFLAYGDDATSMRIEMTRTLTGWEGSRTDGPTTATIRLSDEGRLESTVKTTVELEPAFGQPGGPVTYEDTFHGGI